MDSKAGWYPNRANALMARYWNGVAWTVGSRPLSTFCQQVNPSGIRVVKFDERLRELPVALRPPTSPTDTATAPAPSVRASGENVGWFPDQTDVALERWFDGAAWSGATRFVQQHSPPETDGKPGNMNSSYAADEDSENDAYLAVEQRRGTTIRGMMTIIFLAVSIGSFAGAGQTVTETWVCTGRAFDCLAIEQTSLSTFLNGSAWIALVATAVSGWKWAARKLSSQ